jgi:hypothetical protein
MNDGARYFEELQIWSTNIWSRRIQKILAAHDHFLGIDMSPFTSEVFDYPHFVELKSKVIFLELIWEKSSPQKILLVVDCCGAHDAIPQNWTWGELQAHHVDNNTSTLSLNTGQWKEDLKYTSESRDTDGRLYMRFRTDVTRSNEDVRNHSFLDNIRKDDTLILWLCPPPLESQFSFSWCGARMRVEARAEETHLKKVFRSDD